MTDAVSSVCSADLPCCWQQTTDRFSPREAEPEKWIQDSLGENRGMA